MTRLHIAYDDVTLGQIPQDAPLVLAYVDGNFANYPAAVQRFGAGRVRGITVRGEHGDHIYWCDCETGDLSIPEAISWTRYEVQQLRHTARGPYCQVSNMQQVIDGLQREGVPREAYPIWTAHYAGEHLCGPSTCAYPGFRSTADGTQFTDRAEGRSLDESVVTDRWLGQGAGGGGHVDPNAYPGSPIREGAAGGYVSHIQQRLVSAYHWQLAVDGVFGQNTRHAVETFQRNHGLAVDGVVGPATWGKLFA